MIEKVDLHEGMDRSTLIKSWISPIHFRAVDQLFEKQYIAFEQPAMFHRCMLHYCFWWFYFSSLELGARQAIKKTMTKCLVKWNYFLVKRVLDFLAPKGPFHSNARRKKN